MKRIVLILSFILIYNYSVAQNNNSNTCGELYYTQTMNIGFNIIEKSDFLMTFNNNESYSEEINIKSNKNNLKGLNPQNKENNFVNKRIHIPERTNLNPKFFYNSGNDFYYMTIMANESIIVKEDKKTWNWQLHEETKKINGFVCKKATIDFHGRSYTAWFTNKISVPFGPWKFQGLSGLVLEAYDTNKAFHTVITKIELNNKNCQVNFDKEKLKKALTTSEFKQKMIDIRTSMALKMRSRAPKGATIIKKSNEECDECPKGLENFDEKK